jgi:restriction system protein
MQNSRFNKHYSIASTPTKRRFFKMAIWVVRAGPHGEYEEKFIKEKRVYVTWDDLDVNLSILKQRNDLTVEMNKRYPDTKPKTIQNWVSQIWPFAHEMKLGDIIIVPLKSQPAIQIGEIDGEYQFNADGPDPYYHWRSVKWIGEAIPRANFGQDLLYSFGAFMTIFRVQRNNAEERIAAMRANGWKAESIKAVTKLKGEDNEEEKSDLEALAHDQIAQLISAKFKGHALTRLIEAILKAQGYATYISPEGADGGADILAGAGPLGFGSPRLCVEVKSVDMPVDRPAVDKLLGAVTKFGAQEGLFVSWSGFKSNVHKELAPSFFRMRLWSQKEILEALFANYDRLDDDIKAELPLKRVWMVAVQEDG